MTFLLKADYELNEKAFIYTIWHSGNWHYIFQGYVPFEEDHHLCVCANFVQCQEDQAAYQCKIHKFAASSSTLKQGLNTLLDLCLGQLDPEVYRVKMFSVQGYHLDTACSCEIVFLLVQCYIKYHSTGC